MEESGVRSCRRARCWWSTTSVGIRPLLVRYRACHLASGDPVGRLTTCLLPSGIGFRTIGQPASVRCHVARNRPEHFLHQEAVAASSSTIGIDERVDRCQATQGVTPRCRYRQRRSSPGTAQSPGEERPVRTASGVGLSVGATPRSHAVRQSAAVVPAAQRPPRERVRRKRLEPSNDGSATPSTDSWSSKPDSRTGGQPGTAASSA